MVGKELSLRKEGPVDLREIAAKTTLKEVRQKGHTYVELRRNGKRIIFFCTICLTPCYSDTVLFDHLKGNLHTRRYAAAKATLIGPVPWPFNDGVLFFSNSGENEIEKDKDASMSDVGSQSKALVIHSESEVNSRFKGGSKNGKNRHKNLQLAISGGSRALSCNELDGSLIIPRVLLKEVVSDLMVQLLGIGSVSYRIFENNESPGKITKIWCAWMGKEQGSPQDEVAMTQMCNFALVNFGYTYDLGRKCGSDEQDLQLSAGSYFMIDDAGQRGVKRKKSFSDQEASSEESNGQISPEKVDGESSRQLVRVFSSKSARRELRKQKRIAAERACDICGQMMLQGKDVVALLNCKTGLLACSSRNGNGAFHLFHASCLVHWILLCEYEILTDRLNNPKGHRGRKPKAGQKNKIMSVLCPECQGTGIHVEGEEYEKPSISLSEMFRYKLKAIEAHKAWMKNPEVLEHCSTGLYFPCDSVGNAQEVVSLKQMHFYRAEE
ncbi:hypothetical protein LUZ61_019404 [Rhynchospora tenuis]|uniref:C2H2-type domain-containing protein n=1 Tax=Rhynchospora tenuis TaxID=198213 RepID=A0AAD6EMS5_9POAL|nr:hypothetical protein LUZ61_019404 [Rhynchospora tenuis]